MRSVHEIVRTAESNYLDRPIKTGKYVERDTYDVVETIHAYLNSTQISGKKDSLGRDKPFFNIVKAAVNVWYRATDIDRKDIRLLPSLLDHTVHAFIATKLLQQWMRDSRFGVFLNEWGRMLAAYGSCVCKFVEKDGKLVANVIPWQRLIFDPIDFKALPVIEKLYYTPQQLLSHPAYDKETVQSLLDAKQNRKLLGEEQQSDDFDEFIEVYEVHGEMEDYLLQSDPKPKDEKNVSYVQQMHVVSFVAGKDGKYHDFTLFSGREKKHPYILTHLMKEDGQTLSVGAVEQLFEAQWMMNHYQKNIKDTLDITSKIIFQTSDKKFATRNVLSAIETGEILVHDPNAPLTSVYNTKPDISALISAGERWQLLSQDVTSTPDAMRGNTLPSNTPFSLGAYLGGQANSLFELMTENKGFHVEEMFNEFVLPHLFKKMDTSDEVVLILDADDITQVDARFVPREAKRKYLSEYKRSIIEGEIPTEFDQAGMEQGVKQGMAEFGNMRSFKPSDIDTKSWKKTLEDLDMKLVVEVTNEQQDKQAVLQTLSTVLQTVASNPLVLQDPNARLIFNTILSETGKISPIQLAAASAAPPSDGGASLNALSNITNEQPATAGQT